MNKWFDFLIRHFSTKKVIIFLCMIVVLHVLFIVHLLKTNQISRQEEIRNRLFQKIENTIHLLRDTPLPKRQAIINAIEDPVIQVTLSEKPRAPIQLKKYSAFQIFEELKKSQKTFFISIPLNDGQWINIESTLYTHLVLMQLFFLLTELLFFGAILITLWSIHRFSFPLKAIKSSADRLGIDVAITPVDVRGPKAIQEVSDALNQMQNRILQLIRNRTFLLATISHDLRTPIMRARLRLQFIDDSHYKTQLLGDLSEIEHMITETLAFAREESRQENKIPIDLVSLLCSIVDDAVDMGHHVKLFTNKHRIAFAGRPIALKRAFTNIINNAIRYAGNAIVHISERERFIVIKIEDNGPGIIDTDLEKVFEPFYRGDHSRSRDHGGVGLGLASARDIILSHHGRIKLKNKKTHGLAALIIFKIS